ncbi:hypothetical protein [Burkholderia multivorans]|uniref:hypothetical protein n=1 Tax=Burkholderia multivorans TaxID=87883 RepID=UPI0002781B4D|nr:hypothetical protein [Burkholderia multivorans]EJO57262.1 hypothetical protein BURMUCF2_A1495 [Burkholderia multivorans CF2]MBU9472074.1 hypothetical protein [Burkholderia multivorans]
MNSIKNLTGEEKRIADYARRIMQELKKQGVEPVDLTKNGKVTPTGHKQIEEAANKVKRGDKQ